MSSIKQLIKNNHKRIKRIKKSSTPALSKKKVPFLRGVCFKVRTTSPKKPNSAVRKIARVKLTTKKMITAAIPGQGHNLQKYSVVLVRGGHTRDIPGVRYKLIRGKYDFDTNEAIIRGKKRSKYGLKKLKKKE